MKNNIFICKQWLFFFAFTFSISGFAQKAPIANWKILKVSETDSILLANAWKAIVYSICTKNYEELRKSSLKNIYGESLGHIWPGFSKEQSVSTDSFINIALIKHSNQHFIDVIEDSTYRVNAIIYQDRNFPNFRLAHGKKPTLFEVYYKDYAPTGNGLRDENYYVFRFVKVNNEYKLFGLSLEWPSPLKYH